MPDGALTEIQTTPSHIRQADYRRSPQLSANESHRAQDRRAIIEDTPTRTPETTTNPFTSMNENLIRLVNNIENGKDIQRSKLMLEKILKAREKYYRDAVQAINHDVQPVEGKENLYKIGNTEIYGSIASIMDATPSLINHIPIAKAVSFPVTNGEHLQGENVQPRYLVESLSVLQGSLAQKRIQPYGADIDLTEYVKVRGNHRAEAGEHLAETIQKSVQEITTARDANGKDVTIHFRSMRISAPIDALDRKTASTWNLTEIKQGHKSYATRDGRNKTLVLQDACTNPVVLSTNYLCVTEDTVFTMSKNTDVTFVDDQNKPWFERPHQQADALQQIYFSDPSNFHVIEKAFQADLFVTYIKEMKREIRETNPGYFTGIKQIKRLYNFYKALGDIGGAEELGEFFQSPEAAIYQLTERYKQARNAVKDGILTAKQREEIKSQLISALEKSNHPRSEEALAILTSIHVHENFAILYNLNKQIVNDQAEHFISIHPHVKKTIAQIMKGI